MTDDEMKAMPIPALQDEGLLFLWVTGRAMEIGRECMRVWGYTRVDEVIWVKTNQVRSVSRTSTSISIFVTFSYCSFSESYGLVGLAIGLIIPRSTCLWE